MVAMVKDLFLAILDMSYAAGWLMAAVIFLRVLIRKAPRWMICLLWALVAVRLVCPLSIESVFSLIPEKELLSEVAAVREWQDVSYEEQWDAVIPTYVGVENVHSDTEPADSAISVISLMDILSIVWAAGVVLMISYGILGYYRIKRRTDVSMPVRDNIFKCDAVHTPFILGIFRPRIFLPSMMEDSREEYVVAHERAHIRRGDHLWKPLGFLILCVYWFHPLCWISYLLFCRDIELACDEYVVRAMNLEDKKSYAEALLSCSTAQKGITVSPLAFGEVGVKQRIKSVLSYRKPAFWVIVVSMAACVIVAVCFLTNPRQSGEEGLPIRLPAAEEVERIRIENGSNQDGAAEHVRQIKEADQMKELLGILAAAERTNRLTVQDYPQTDSEVIQIDIAALDGTIYTLFAYEENGICYIEQPYQGIYQAEERIADFLYEDMDLSDTPGNEDTVNETKGYEEVLDRWAKAFVNRDGETIAALASQELAAELSAEDMLMGSEGSYSFGVSSPWPQDADTDYTVYNYADQNMAEIYYYAHTSDPHIYYWKEEIHYEWTGDRYIITEEDMMYYDNISSGAEFAQAYRGRIDGTMIDYTRNQLGEALNDNAASSDRDAYKALLSPESAAVSLLNLSADPTDVKIALHEGKEETGMVSLDITFLQDQDTVRISMIQPYGMYGIWVPADYRVDVVSRFMEADWSEVRSISGIADHAMVWGPDIICIGEIPEYDIRVYGYNDEEVKGMGVAIDIAGDVNYFDWIYTTPQGIMPKLYWDEKARQLQIAFHTFTGTGVSAEELVVLQQYDTGTLVPHYFLFQDYTDIMSERIEWSFDADTRNLTLTDGYTGREIAVVAVSEGEVTYLECGCISNFTLGETITLYVEPGYVVDDQAIAEYEGMPVLEFEVEYEWSDDRNGQDALSFHLGDLIRIDQSF